MTTLKKWRGRIWRTHVTLAHLDVMWWLASISLLCVIWSFWIGLHHDRTLLWIVTLGVTFSLLRLWRTWSFSVLWRTVDRHRSPSSFSARIANDFFNKRGYFPDPERQDQALSALLTQSAPQYPFAHYIKKLLHGWWQPILLTVALLATDLIPSISFPKNTSTIHISPPDYLELPSRTLDEREENIHLYPGSLVTLKSSNRQALLTDHTGRRYLPRRQNDDLVFEARVLEALTLDLSHPPRILEIEILEDAHPTVDWTSTPLAMTLSSHSVAFSSKDDHGLLECLITVNGEEVEYAGDASGKQQFQYRWDFDPTDHLPLLGGNIQLQITAYDNDRVSGPKKTLSSPLVWTFPGVQHLAAEALARLDELRKQVDQRLDPSQSASPRSIQNELNALAEKLDQNPAVPEAFTRLVQNMERAMAPHTMANQAQPSEAERQQLTQNESALDLIQQQLEEILQTVKASEMVQKLKQLASKVRDNKFNPDDFFETYKELEQLLRDSDTNPAFAETMLQKFSQAELAAQMGETDEAAAMLEQLSSQMRQQPSQSRSGPDSPLTKQFQAMVQQLQELEQEQNTLIGELKNVDNTPSEAWQSFQRQLPQHPHWKAYEDWIQHMKRSAQRPDQQKKLMDELATPLSPAATGQRLRYLFQDMILAQRGQPQKRPWPSPQQMPPDLQEDYRKVLPELSQGLGKAIAPSLPPAQGNLAMRGSDFASKFRSTFATLLPHPQLFAWGDQAARSAQEGHRQLSPPNEHADRANLYMSQAQSLWQRMLAEIQRMQQMAQQAMGQSGQPLTIGADGQLQLSQQGRPMGDGDGQFEHRNEDVGVPLPEDFKHSQVIEKHLREALQNASDPSQQELFRQYMLDLLE